MAELGKHGLENYAPILYPLNIALVVHPTGLALSKHSLLEMLKYIALAAYFCGVELVK